MKKIYSPVGFYVLWIIICLFFLLLVPFISRNYHSSAQVPFVLGTYAIIGLVCGTFLISLLNMILFKSWVKKFWYINGLITFVTGFVIIYFLIKMITL